MTESIPTEFPFEESPSVSEKSSASGMPHSREAEEAVIGAVLINPEVYYDLAQFLQAEDFYIHRLRFVWEAYTRLHERRVPVDILTVSEELGDMGRLEEIGGPAYLTALLNQVPTTLHAEAYGKIVESNAIRRKLLTAANSIATLAYDENEVIETVMGESEKAIFNVGERKMRHDVRPIREVLSEYYDRIDELARRDEDIVGVPTGFTDLDKMLGGLQPSDLLITAGRPGMGKTALMLTMVHNAALIHKKRVAVFSLEMSNEQVVQRLIAQQTGIDSQRLRTGKLTDDDWPIFNHAIEVLGDTRIYLDDTPALSPLQLRTKCRRLHMEYGLDLVILDYLQLMSSETRTDNRVQEVSYISRSLKQLARELNVPLMAAAQLSRAVEQRADKEPQLSDLRESGCLTGDTLVALAETGQNVPLSTLDGRENFQVWSLNPQTMKIEAASVSRAFTTGIKPVYKLVTRLGRTIRATANHRFLTVQGWKRLDELLADDFVALPRVISGQQTQTMTNAELALLGHLLGDGCTLPRHVIQYTTRELDLAETVAALSTKIFGEAVNPRINQERRWYQVYLTSTRHHTHNVRSAVTEWLEDLGAFGLRSYEKFVPAKVFGQPEAAIALFLRHLWATDGSIQLVKGKKTRPLAYYSSSSERLARDVQSLLLTVGINALLRTVSQGKKGRTQYQVTITGKPDLELFAAKIGAVGIYKQQRLQEVSEYLREHPANTNRDVIPREVWRMYAVSGLRRITELRVRSDSKGNSNGLGSSCSMRCRSPPALAPAARSAPSVGSPTVCQVPSFSTRWALLQPMIRVASSSSGAACGPAAFWPSKRTSPSGP